MLNLKVEDVNDNQPLFQPSLYRTKVNIHTFNKELPLLRLLAIDRDFNPNFNTIQYSIVNETSKYLENFRIDSKSGTLFFIGEFFPNLPELLELHIISTDLAGLQCLEPVRMFQKIFLKIKLRLLFKLILIIPNKFVRNSQRIFTNFLFWRIFYRESRLARSNYFYQNL